MSLDSDISKLDKKVQSRIVVERKIVRKTVKTFLEAGFTLGLDNDGDEDHESIKWYEGEEIFKNLMDVDDEHLYVRHPDNQISSVYFVYGNDGYDVICDYGTSLEEWVGPIQDYAESLDTE